MYCTHFGFDQSPFRITPDPAFFFPGGNRGAVLDALLYAITRGEGIVKVVGEVGSGKTMLCRMLEREMPPRCELIYLANPNLNPEEILPAIACELKLPRVAGTGKAELLHQIHDHLLARHADNRRVVMFVEEAQCMPPATLEEIRLLSNLETSHDKLLQIVLFGQPELDTKLSRHEMRQLDERITYRFQLAPLGPRELRDYLVCRLTASGYRGPEVFTPGALRTLARGSQGLLRRINILADKALLAAYSGGARQVSAQHVARAVRDSEYRSSTRLPRTLWPWSAVAASLLALAALGGYGIVRQGLPQAAPLADERVEEPPGPGMNPAELTAFSLAVLEARPATAAADSAAGSDPLLSALARLDRMSSAPEASVSGP
jgi:type II secretory pathway predicted ATPase ExeA